MIKIKQEAAELGSLRGSSVGNKIKAPQIVGCGRDLRLWELQNGISGDIEVGGSIRHIQSNLEIGDFRSGEKNHVVLHHSDDSIGSLHSHLAVSGPSLGDAKNFMSLPLQFSGVINESNVMYVMIKDTPHQVDPDQLVDNVRGSMELLGVSLELLLADVFRYEHNIDKYFRVLGEYLMDAGVKAKFFKGDIADTYLTRVV